MGCGMSLRLWCWVASHFVDIGVVVLVGGSNWTGAGCSWSWRRLLKSKLLPISRSFRKDQNQIHKTETFSDSPVPLHPTDFRNRHHYHLQTVGRGPETIKTHDFYRTVIASIPTGRCFSYPPISLLSLSYSVRFNAVCK